MTLQNGSGHEDILGEFTDAEHIIIGTTEDNGAVLGAGHIRRGGVGNTNIGMLVEDKNAFLPKVKDAFDCCGFNVKIHGNIQQLIWNKLFTNVSLSVVTGILQVKIGYIRNNEYAWNMTIRFVENVSIMTPDGVTSICADLRAGRKTEVDNISGSVVKAAAKVGVEVPTHKFVVNMVHAMECREK